MRRGCVALFVVLVSGFGGALLQACSSSSGGNASTDASSDGLAPDAARDSSADARAVDAHSVDATSADGEARAVPTFLAHFDDDASQLPEGLWRLGEAGTPIVGYAPLATLVTVTADGGTQPFGPIGEAGTASNSLTLGITTDTSGNVYVGVGAGFTPDAGHVPAPGVYRFAPDGGAGSLFSSALGMNFPNGLDFIGTQLFIADSDGAVYSIDPSGNAVVWSADPLLAPDVTACDGGVPLSIGANGIVHDSQNVYVTNTDHGRLIKIPMDSDGGAGTATTIVDSCALVGADGLVLDTTDNTFLVALNVQNKLVRVTMSGQMTVLASGSPLNTPASVVIDSTGGARRLLFTNATFFSGTNPGLLALPLP